MKKTLILACLLLGLSLSACNNSVGGEPEISTAPSSNSNAQTPAPGVLETAISGQWVGISGKLDSAEYLLDLGRDKRLVFSKIFHTTPVTGARVLGSWSTSGDTLTMDFTSTEQTQDGVTWSAFSYQRKQLQLFQYTGDTLKLYINIVPVVFVRSTSTSP